jgi:hypothetical protein
MKKKPEYRVTKADVACGGWYVRLSEADYRTSGGRISWGGVHGPFESEAAAVAWAQSQGAIEHADDTSSSRGATGRDKMESVKGLTNEMIRVLRIAERDGMVVAGKGSHAGRVERVSASALLALIRRGLLSHVYGPEGGVGGRLTEAGRVAIAPEKKTSAQLDAEIAAALSKTKSSGPSKDPTEDEAWAEIDSEYAGTVQSLIDDGYSREDARASAEDNIRETYGEEVVLWLPKHERRRRASARGA